MLRARGVSKRYGSVVALDDVDLDAQPGEVVGLVGPNGAGKTTLVKIVAGLTRPDAGTVEVNGVDIFRIGHRASEAIGYASQDVGVYPQRKVSDNLYHFGRLAGLHRRELAARVDAVAGRLGLTDLMGRRALRLSGGEKRRLHVAVALLGSAPFIILDEPTANVDVETRKDLLDLVRELRSEGSAVLYSTHYLEEIEHLDARVVMIDQGSIIASGAVSDLIDRHGAPTLELTFLQEPPVLKVPGADCVVDGFTVRLVSRDGASIIAATLSRLGDHAEDVASIDVRRSSLESVYFNLRDHAAHEERESSAAEPS